MLSCIDAGRLRAAQRSSLRLRIRVRARRSPATLHPAWPTPLDLSHHRVAARTNRAARQGCSSTPIPRRRPLRGSFGVDSLRPIVSMQTNPVFSGDGKFNDDPFHHFSRTACWPARLRSPMPNPSRNPLRSACSMTWPATSPTRADRVCWPAARMAIEELGGKALGKPVKAIGGTTRTSRILRPRSRDAGTMPKAFNWSSTCRIPAPRSRCRKSRAL